jgi:hypothetical protein
VDRLMVRSWILLLLAGALVASFAAPAAIGVATAKGSFLLDRSAVQGNATLFEGAVVETTTTPSLVRLQDGPRMQLGSTSRGKVYGDRLVLEKGEGQLEGTQSYRIEARELRILPESADSVARVALGEPGRVTVAALTGGVRVTTADGILVAKLERGTTLEFEPQAAGASAPVSVTGCLTGLNGRFLLKDDTANVSFELRGQDLGQYAGQHVTITATVLKEVRPGQGAVQVIQVTQIRRLAGACPVAASNPSKGGVAKKGATSGTTKVVIAGVAIAAAAGGTAIGLTGDEKQSISR